MLFALGLPRWVFCEPSLAIAGFVLQSSARSEGSFDASLIRARQQSTKSALCRRVSQSNRIRDARTPPGTSQLRDPGKEVCDCQPSIQYPARCEALQQKTSLKSLANRTGEFFVVGSCLDRWRLVRSHRVGDSPQERCPLPSPRARAVSDDRRSIRFCERRSS